HQRQRLALGLEAGDDLTAVHARLDDLERHLAADGLLLLGDEDQAHAALTDLLHQLVRAEDRPGAFADGRLAGGDEVGRRPFQEGAGPEMVADELLHLAAQLRIARAGFLQKRGTLLGGGDLDGLRKNGVWAHGRFPRTRASTYNA